MLVVRIMCQPDEITSKFLCPPEKDAALFARPGSPPVGSFLVHANSAQENGFSVEQGIGS